MLNVKKCMCWCLSVIQLLWYLCFTWCLYGCGMWSVTSKQIYSLQKSDNKWFRKIRIVAERNLLENVGNYMIWEMLWFIKLKYYTYNENTDVKMYWTCIWNGANRKRHGVLVENLFESGCLNYYKWLFNCKTI